ncbi:MAG: hypothetical protein O3A33_01760 [Chloroflexi bacterium]|nr:hypothetical protein [Chloroflexota bacterium]
MPAATATKASEPEASTANAKLYLPPISKTTTEAKLYSSPMPTHSPDEPTSGEQADTTAKNIGGTQYGYGEPNCKSDPSPVLTSHITDLNTISNILPPSVISGNWYKNRSYLNIDAEYGTLAPSVPVYAPADSELIGITYYLQPMPDINGDWQDVPQYELRLSISCEVTYGFDHLSELATGVSEYAPEVPANTTRDAEKQVSISVKACDLMGYTTGTIVAHSWDFIFNNTTVQNSFANQERYEKTGDLRVLLYAECPYDYFEGDMGDEYRALFGGSNGSAAEADCNTSFDVPGSIYGGWFQTPYVDQGEYGRADWGMTIALMPDGYLRINEEQVSVQLGPQDDSFTDPRTVTDEHCFVSANGTGGLQGWHVFLKMLTPDTMAATFNEGSCPKSLPDDHTVYYR